MSITHVDRIPKGLHHLEQVARSKFVQKYPSRAPHPPTGYTQIRDRVKRWNIIPGDKVRITVGKAQDKFVDEQKGSAGGWKIYTVASVDMERNRIYLEGYTNKKSNPIRPVPEDIDSQPDDVRNSYTQQKNFLETRKPVQYSNVQLCVEENGTDSVFATRIATSQPFFNRDQRRWLWHRYAARLSSQECNVAPDAERGQVRIPWPKRDAPKDTAAGTYDTLPKDVVEPTLQVGGVDSIPREIVPTSLRAPAPEDQTWSDEYIFNPAARSHQLVEAAMPLYLSEELSPRFSRAKQTRGWNERRAAEKAARTAIARAAVQDWEDAGRDTGLEEVLSLDAVSLEGVPLRSRTRAEVREAVEAEVDEEVAAARRATARARAAGQLFSHEMQDWVDGEKGIKLARKLARKERKERKITERLEKLTLADAKNQVVPRERREE